IPWHACCATAQQRLAGRDNRITIHRAQVGESQDFCCWGRGPPLLLARGVHFRGEYREAARPSHPARTGLSPSLRRSVRVIGFFNDLLAYPARAARPTRVAAASTLARP